jgi:hypothetical protein
MPRRRNRTNRRNGGRNKAFVDSISAQLNVSELTGSAFRFSYQSLLPTLQDRNRPTYIDHFRVRFESSGADKSFNLATNCRFQIYGLDPVSATLVPFTNQVPLSITSPTSVLVRPNKGFYRWEQPSSTVNALVISIFTGNPAVATTFQFYATIDTHYRLAPEIVTQYVPPTVLLDFQKLTIKDQVTEDDDSDDSSITVIDAKTRRPAKSTSAGCRHAKQ